MSDLQVFALPLETEVQPGDDLAALLAGILQSRNLTLRDEDVLVVCHKVVSKAEGRIVDLKTVAPSPVAKSWAARFGKDPRLIELVLSQARRIIRMENGIIIGETAHGYITANCGVDLSNAPADCAVLLPVSPDVSAKRLTQALSRRFQCRCACLVSDSFGRPWRIGLVDVALGVSGFPPLIDLRGQRDRSGRKLRSTVLALADQATAAAGLVMGKRKGIPAALIRGLRFGKPAKSASGKDLLRPASEDLFR